MENSTNISALNQPRKYSFQSTAQLTSVNGWFFFTMAVSFGGSILLILLLASSFKQTHPITGSRLLLVQLLSLELFLIGVSFPIQTMIAYNRLMEQPVYLDCSVFLLVHSSVIFTENWNIFVMALNRFIAIELPHYYRRTVSRWVGFSTLLTPWMIGVSFILPAYFGIGGEFLFLPTSGACYQKANGNAYILVEFAMGFYVPIALTGLLYSIIFFRLSFLRVRAPRTTVQPPRIAIELAGRSGVLHVHPEEPELLNAGRAKRIAKAKMLLASFVWYCLCFVPGPIITASYQQLFRADPMLQLWLVKSLLICGYAGCPVRDYWGNRTSPVPGFW